MESVLLDIAGHRRSPATMPGYHRGRTPRNKGEQYPADPPTVEEIIAVMRNVGDRCDGRRLRALIVLLWRAGLRISEALALQESDLDRSRGAVLVRRGKGGKRREVGMDRWAWEQLGPWLEVRQQLPNRGALVCDPRPDRGQALGSLGRAQTVASCGRDRWSQASVRATPAPTRPRGRDGARGRTARRDSAPARTRQPRHHQHLPPRHRQQRDHQHRPRTALADNLGHRRPPDEAIDQNDDRVGSARAGRLDATPAWRDAGGRSSQAALPLRFGCRHAERQIPPWSRAGCIPETGATRRLVQSFAGLALFLVCRGQGR
jgi:integrase